MSADKQPSGTPEEFEAAMQEFLLAQAPRRKAEMDAVRQLGDRIGYGNLMHTASEIWASVARINKTDGSNFLVGPCASMVVTCPHEFDQTEKFLDSNGHCEWCCNTGWVVKRVADEMAKING